MGRPPLSESERAASLRARYEANVVRNEVGCWGWTRKVQTRPGYPYLSDGHSTRVPMHRYSYEIHIGPVPAGK